MEPKFEFLTRRKGFKRVMQSIYDTVEIQKEQQQQYLERGNNNNENNYFNYRSPFEMKINVKNQAPDAISLYSPLNIFKKT